VPHSSPTIAAAPSPVADCRENRDLTERLLAARVGFVSGRVFHDDGHVLWTDAGLGRLIDALRARVGQFNAALSPAMKQPLLDHRLTLAPGQVLSLPELPSIGRGFAKFAACRRIIRELEQRSDVVIVQLPFEAPLALFGARKPRIYHVCADIWAFANRSTRFAGWKRLPALAVGGLIDHIQGRVMRRRDVRVVTNGRALQVHYGNPPGQAVISSTICDSEIMSVPRSRPPDAPFRVLYVGYIRHEKGVDLLVDAFARLSRISKSEAQSASSVHETSDPSFFNVWRTPTFWSCQAAPKGRRGCWLKPALLAVR
jgi:glycosyltransferase involved in cell wall biosynthesis